MSNSEAFDILCQATLSPHSTHFFKCVYSIVFHLCVCVVCLVCATSTFLLSQRRRLERAFWWQEEAAMVTGILALIHVSSHHLSLPLLPHCLLPHLAATFYLPTHTACLPAYHGSTQSMPHLPFPSSPFYLPFSLLLYSLPYMLLHAWTWTCSMAGSGGWAWREWEGQTFLLLTRLPSGKEVSPLPLGFYRSSSGRTTTIPFPSLREVVRKRRGWSGPFFMLPIMPHHLPIHNLPNLPYTICVGWVSSFAACTHAATVMPPLPLLCVPRWLVLLPVRLYFC